MRPFNLLVGIAAVTQGVAQYLAAVERIELDFWPFVQTPSKPLRLAASALAFFIGIVLIATAFTA